VRIHQPVAGELPRMFAWLARRRERQQRQRLDCLHLQLLEQARDLQRGGDIRGFAAKTAEAAEVERQIDALAATSKPPAAPPRA
jgi:hypothetical protein